MKLSPGDIVSIVSVLSMFVFSMINLWRSGRADTEKDAQEMTKISLQLDTLQKGIDEIKSEIKDMKADIRKDHDKLVVLERDVKTLWNKYNEEHTEV